MRYFLTTLLSLLFLSFPSLGQSERPETIVIPVSSVGDVTETRKLILQNTLEDELKTHFRLISQEKFEEAQEKAFQELDYEECTEERCIILIQEMLQVENIFHLQVIGEGQDTQLSLSWRTLDEKRKETDFCEGCKTKELNDKVGGLVEKLVGVKDEVVVKEEQSLRSEVEEARVILEEEVAKVEVAETVEERIVAEARAILEEAIAKLEIAETAEEMAVVEDIIQMAEEAIAKIEKERGGSR